MIKSVNIDGKDYIIRRCEECPFCTGFDDFENCTYPENPHYGLFDFEKEENDFPKDCPLGMVEDCCTCKYEAMKDEWTEPCCHCLVSWDIKARKKTTPTKWEVKE